MITRFSRKSQFLLQKSTTIAVSTINIETCRLCSSSMQEQVETNETSVSNSASSFFSSLDMHGICTKSNKSRKEHRETGMLMMQNRQQQQSTSSSSSSTENSSLSNSTTTNPSTSIHSKENVFSVVSERTAGNCEICGKRFFDTETLEKHMKTRHLSLASSSTTTVDASSISSSSTTKTFSSSFSNVLDKWEKLVLLHTSSSPPINISEEKKDAKEEAKQTTEPSTEKVFVVEEKETEKKEEEMKTQNVVAESERIVEEKQEITTTEKADKSNILETKTTKEKEEKEEKEQQQQNFPEMVSSSSSENLTQEELDKQNFHRAQFLHAQLQVVEATTDCLVAWTKRESNRKRALKLSPIQPPVYSPAMLLANSGSSKNKISNNNEQQKTLVSQFVQQQKDSSSSSSNNNKLTSLLDTRFPSMNPFYTPPKQPFGMCEAVTVDFTQAKKKIAKQQQRQQQQLLQSSNKQSQRNISNINDGKLRPRSFHSDIYHRCEVGGVASISLVGVVVNNIQRGFMKYNNKNSKNINSSNISSNTNSNQQEEPTCLIQVACRNFQCDKLSGRVSMLKHIITLRIRNNDTFFNLDSPKHKKLQKGDLLYCRGQLQLHTIFDLASRRWNCNNLVVDVAPGVGEISIVNQK